MAKINILFDEKNYSIDEANLAPATDALKAHFETLGGEGGGVVEVGKEYQLKKVITEDDFKTFVAKAYGFNGETAKEYVLFCDPETHDYVNGVILVGVTAQLIDENTFAWQFTIGDYFGERIYASYVLNGDAFGMENGWYKQDMSTGRPVYTALEEPPVITIPSAEYANPDLETISMFFDIPSAGGDLDITLDGAVYKVDSAKLEPATNSLIAHLETLKGGEGGGTLEYGKEYTFKSVITREDCEKYIANAEPHVTPNDRENWYCIYSDTSDGTGEYTVMLIHDYSTDAFTILYNEYEKLFMVDASPTWQTLNFSTGAPVPEPTDPPTMPITDGGLMSADLATTSVFFNLGGGSGNGGDTKIVINGVEYLVDSAKLADAKSALSAALEALQSGGTN